MFTRFRILAAVLLFLSQSASAHEANPYLEDPNYSTYLSGDFERIGEGELIPYSCTKATREQLATVNAGHAKLNQFLRQCADATNSSAWCPQLARPNPASASIFRCTYGESQPHFLIHPDTNTWKDAFEAVQLIRDLESKGLKVCQIYNWWRPEPYNKNVGGSPTRHPFGTAVDVRFCSNADADKAFDELCRFRPGRIRAIGHYGTSALHFGVGDHTANTWGRECR